MLIIKMQVTWIGTVFSDDVANPFAMMPISHLVCAISACELYEKCVL